MTLRACLVVLLWALLSSIASAQNEPFRNPDLALEDRVRDLISRLTLQEKAALLNHRGSTVERFNIRSDHWNQCLHGVSWDGGATTLFPIPTAMAATWNPQLVRRAADAISTEARAIYNAWQDDPNLKGTHKGLIYRSPVINILRNPYWGRNHEAWSEDPVLCGRMAVAFVQGLQGDDPRYLKLAATLKHFAVNNVEVDRKSLNVTVPLRMLHEYWLPHFRDAIVEGKAQSVMASYNAINGVPNNMNHWLLTEVLKQHWQHEGFVVSDLGGVKSMVKGHAKDKISFEEAVAKSIMAGCDFSDKEYEDRIPAAVKSGLLTQERLDDALMRVLRVRFRLGEFDPKDRVPYRSIPLSVLCSEPHRALSLQVSRESIVLLKNEGRTLPLDRSRVKKLAVIGRYAADFVLGNPVYVGKLHPDPVTHLRGLREALPGAEVVHEPGWVAKATREQADAALQKAIDAAKSADAVMVCVGNGFEDEREGIDRSTLALSADQQKLVERVTAANPRTIVVLSQAGPLAIPWIKEHVPAIVCAWWSGEQQGRALAEVIFGDVSPAGRLPYTVYASDSQVPPRDEYDISKGYTYMYLRSEPLFAFGHGLGYSTFEYQQLSCADHIASTQGELAASVTIRNTGDREADEVVQLYFTPPEASFPRPKRALLAFERVHLKPAETRTLTLRFPAQRMAYYDEARSSFVLQRGIHQLQVGASSADIRLRHDLKVE